MKIAVDATQLCLPTPTGTYTYLSNILHSLAKIDKESKYFLCYNSDLVNDLVSARFAEYQKYENFECVPIKKAFSWTHFSFARETFKLKPDILFLPNHTSPLIRYPGAREVAVVHDVSTGWLKYGPAQYTCRKADHIIAVSQATKKDIVKDFRIAPEKIQVIYEGVDTKFYFKRSQQEIEAVKNKYEIVGDYVLFLGTLDTRKNIKKIIEGFAYALKILGKSELKLVLAGKCAPGYEEIYEYPAELGISSQVIFSGYIENGDVPALYSGAKSFIFASLFEGFGLPVLESLACGTPVVISRNSSLIEIGRNVAVYVSPNNYESIGQGIYRSLLVNINSTEYLYNVQEILNTFSWDSSAQELLKTLKNIHKH